MSNISTIEVDFPPDLDGDELKKRLISTMQYHLGLCLDCPFFTIICAPGTIIFGPTSSGSFQVITGGNLAGDREQCDIAIKNN